MSAAAADPGERSAANRQAWATREATARTRALGSTRTAAWQMSYSENVDYGPFLTGRDVVVDLLVDDGVPDRGHRRNIFDASAHVVGIACGPHPKLRSMCVIDQANGYRTRRLLFQN